MKFMKNLMLLLIMFVATSVYSSEDTGVWARMYKRSGTMELRYSVMLNIVDINDRSIVPLLEDILAEDIVSRLSDKRSVNEEDHFIKFSTLVIKKIGEMKITGSAENVFQVYLNHKDPLLQSECLIALGNMRAVQYIDDIAYILHLKNQRPLKGAYSSNDLDNESRVAFGAISALDRFRSIEGYSPVFFASLGWYNQRVKEYADSVLLTITDNPVDAIIPILLTGDIRSKEKATFQIDKSPAKSEEKIRAAREALHQGQSVVPGDIKDGMVLTSIRKQAIITLWNNKSSEAQDVPYLLRSVDDGVDLAEKIYAIKTLGINKSVEANEALNNLLLKYNERSANDFGLTVIEEDVVREIIITLGNRADRSSKYVLTESLYSGYTDGIVRSAKEALKKLKS